MLIDLLDCEDNYRIVYENNKLCGVLPILSKNGEFGDVINSLPYFGSNGGIIAKLDKHWNEGTPPKTNEIYTDGRFVDGDTKLVPGSVGAAATGEGKKIQLGVIAQDIEKTNPDLHQC